MDTLSLYYFSELAKDLHITRTANRLFISQQTLSNHIMRLEEYYGVKLLNRKPSLSLTYAGEYVLGYVWQLLLNGILAHFQKTLTYSSKYGFWGLVILMLWQQVGYMMIIYISGIQNIPGELIEAAQIDGANKVQLLRYVTIPMVMPSITICTFLTLTNGFKLFDQNLALTNGGPDKMSEMLALNIYYTFYGRTGWEGVGQAKAVIFFIIVGVIALIQNKLTTSKEVQQ